MANKKEEVNSIDDLIGKLYAKINRYENKIKKLKKELDTLRDQGFDVDGKDDDVDKDIKMFTAFIESIPLGSIADETPIDFHYPLIAKY